MGSQADRVATFRDLHASGCFVIPNPWDVGSARTLARLGFKALATTSSGFAWTLGRPDNAVTLDEVLAHLRAIAASVEVPVNADFEGGFAVEPEAVAANVTRAVGTGIAGISIEDSTGDAADPLFDLELAVERIRAARAAIDASGTGVLLTGRSEGFIVGRPDLAETIRRLVAYAEAGAECLYAPGPAGRIGHRGGRRCRLPEAGQRARRQRFHDGRRAGCAGGATDQRRRRAGPDGVGWVPAGRRRRSPSTGRSAASPTRSRSPTSTTRSARADLRTCERDRR